MATVTSVASSFFCGYVVRCKKPVSGATFAVEKPVSEATLCGVKSLCLKLLCEV